MVLYILLTIYLLLVIGVLLWMAVIGARFKGTLGHAHPPAELPLVTTIVPARNEERNIGRCARGLVHQDYPNLELIFVDDDSKDATPDILARVAAQDPRVKVVNTGGKPDGWNGKQWACHSGAVQASGEWLCFMDADTYAEPGLITRTLAFAISQGIDMLTLQPWYEMQGLWERIVLPAGLPPLLLVFPPDKVNDPNSPLSMANGQFILIRREVYNAVGGHEAIRQRMMDDFSLAENVKGAGYRLYVVDGMDVMRVRLYRNLREIRSGALKAAVEVSGGWRASTLALIANTLINILPAILLAWAFFSGERQAALLLGALVLFQVFYYGAIRMVGFRMPPWTAITYPVGNLIVNAILLDGMFRVATRRRITWKDRDVMGAPAITLPIKRTDDQPGQGQA
ncbi:MAG: glycosyltransferase family 2 protein [Anaerolineae bacterium]